MARKWRSFDPETTNKEFKAIPEVDRGHLFAAMKAFAKELDGGYRVKNYGEGLMMIKSSNRSQGRCLFFTITQEGDTESLTALLAYKKETDEAPANKIETARARMKRAKEE